MNVDNQVTVTEWVNNYSDMLYGFAMQRIRDSNLAKDLVQDTFLAAWKNVEKYNGEASVKTWLFTILKNKIIDHYRKSSTRLTDELMQKEGDQDIYFDEADHWAKGSYPGNLGVDENSLVEKKEFYSIFTKCKNKLKQVQSAVFTMKYIDGLESEEICKALELSSSNYWVLIHRAKVQLRSCLEANWMAG
jgi:RNA polymerase sigma-70 factor (TIGR02943 family)